MSKATQNEFDVRVAARRLSELLARAGNGEALTITRDGKPVARLVAVSDTADKPDVAETIAKIRALRGEIAREHGGFDHATIKELINEGRKYID